MNSGFRSYSKILVFLIAWIRPHVATNFIFILADDMGWGDPHYNGGNAFTPFLDSIAEGKHTIVFNRFYSENVCSPSRASILTGRVPDRLCIWTANSNGLNNTNEFTIADAAKRGGLTTAHFGKWHVGAFSSIIKNPHMSKQGQRISGPLQNGYTYFYSSQPPAWTHINTNCGCCANKTTGCLVTAKRPKSSPKITPATTCVNPNQLIEGNALKAYNSECDTYHYANKLASEGVASVDELLEGDDTKTIGDAVEKWLRNLKTNKQNDDKISFMATIWFHTPHKYYAATDQWLSKYKNTNYTDDEKLYYADITSMDYQIGRIRKVLQELNYYNDTALFFTADNGPERGSPGSTRGLTGRKRDLLEGGIRNPGLLEWPARIYYGNRKTNFPAKIVDYLPTIMEELNVSSLNPEWPLDGINLLPYINEIAKQESGALIRRPKPLGWVTEHALGGATQNNGSHPSQQMAWMIDDLKLYANRSTAKKIDFHYYLFNITKDPAETTDLSRKFPNVTESMRSELSLWISSVAHSRTIAENNCNSWDPQFPESIA